MASNIIGIIAQRLARILCPHCKYPYHPDAGERRLLGIAHNEEITVYRAAGCETCHHQGYIGRIALMELLKIDNEMDDLIAHRASVHQIKQAALSKGFRPLAADGVRRVLEGVTSLAEIARVVDLTERLA